MFTGHYGNWEILGYVLATLGFETTSVARPLDNAYLNEWIMGVRERQGQKIVGKKGATSEVTDVLERGGAVGFIADQNAGSKGIFVDFFGRKASTYKSIGLLAMHYEVPIVIGYARRVEGQFKFNLGVQDVIYPGTGKTRMIPCVTSPSAIREDSKRWFARPGPVPLASSPLENPAQGRIARGVRLTWENRFENYYVHIVPGNAIPFAAGCKDETKSNGAVGVVDLRQSVRRHGLDRGNQEDDAITQTKSPGNWKPMSNPRGKSMRKNATKSPKPPT